MSPEHLAHKINRHLHRFPLVLEVLDEISESDDPPYPGDQEIRTGAVQAVASMVEHLKQLRRTHQDHCPKTDAELTAMEWLRGKLPEKLLPGELHRELATVLRELIPATQPDMQTPKLKREGWRHLSPPPHAESKPVHTDSR
jgi:hypothetical protein